MTDRWSSDELEGLRVSEAIRQGVLAERDELRAEVERVKTVAFDLIQEHLAEIERLEQETERLREAFENSEAACLIQVQMVRAENELLRLRGDTFFEALKDCNRIHAENERLRAALVQIENWVGKLPSNMGEAALVFEYIQQACRVLDD